MVDFDAYETEFNPDTTGSGASTSYQNLKECLSCDNRFPESDTSDNCPNCRQKEGY